jgi:hypothetical protein
MYKSASSPGAGAGSDAAGGSTGGTRGPEAAGDVIDAEVVEDEKK